MLIRKFSKHSRKKSWRSTIFINCCLSTLQKFLSVADMLLVVFQIFSEQLFIRQLWTVPIIYTSFYVLIMSVSVTEFTSTNDLNDFMGFINDFINFIFNNQWQIFSVSKSRSLSKVFLCWIRLSQPLADVCALTWLRLKRYWIHFLD